ncbi:MAG: caspase family protein [Moorea sp. SIO2B7]|nr:caspase family protein [Moorena sp. SIO2B7]
MAEKSRYYLIACGTSNYNDQDVDNLDSVPTDLQRVVDLLTQKFGYEEALTDLRLNPNKDDLIQQFSDWLQHEERCESDRVIFYYSGHGQYCQGDRHYLLMKDTVLNQLPQRSLPTEDLVRPLNNPGVKIEQILYIIDTCFSQSGAGDIINYVSQAMNQHEQVKGGNNIDVHVIVACRAKQIAGEGLFSQALEKILLQNWTFSELQEDGRYINPSKLCEKVTQEIQFTNPNKFIKQNVKYSTSGSETSPHFFPYLPKTWQTWEEKRHELVKKLLCILKKETEKSLYFVNSFILSRKLLEKFVLNEESLLKKLNEFSEQPVFQGVCPLIACSEWCRLRFDDKRHPRNYKPKLAQYIKDWQTEVCDYRKGIDLDKINQFIDNSFHEFKQLLDKKALRLQIELEPELDKEYNTGELSGCFLVNMNLWIESDNCILAKYPETLRLEPEVIEPNGGDKSEALLTCLKQNDCLSNLVRIVRYSLSESLGKSVVNLALEFFMPCGYFNTPVETICFNYGDRRKALGKEYPIFINSFERYFDEDYSEISDNINIKKRLLWGDIKPQPNELSDDDIEELETELDIETLLEQCEAYDLYRGKSPSELVLKIIEEALPIAVWVRNDNQPLIKKISEWKNWPKKIQDLRKHKKGLEVTLFWDDLYSNPSELWQPLNTDVVD